MREEGGDGDRWLALRVWGLFEYEVRKHRNMQSCVCILATGLGIASSTLAERRERAIGGGPACSEGLVCCMPRVSTATRIVA